PRPHQDGLVQPGEDRRHRQAHPRRRRRDRRPPEDRLGLLRPRHQRDHDGRELPQGQEASPPRRGLSRRPIWRRRPLCRRPHRDRRRRRRAHRRDRARRHRPREFQRLGRRGEGAARRLQEDRRVAGMKLLPAIALLLASSAATAAEAPAEYPSAVQTFLDVCVTGELSVAAREAALQAGGWTPVAEPTLDVPAFGISKAIEKNFNYSKPVSVREWTKSVDGAPVQAVLATFPADRRYPNLCALTFPDVKAAW